MLKRLFFLVIATIIVMSMFSCNGDNKSAKVTPDNDIASREAEKAAKEAGNASILALKAAQIVGAGSGGIMDVGMDAPVGPAILAGLFTAPVVDLADIAYLIPLGNLNPPTHTLPVDHIYFIGYQPKDGTQLRVAVYSPGNARITYIMEEYRTNQAGEKFDHTYAITYVLCLGVVVSIGGYTELSPAIKAVMDSAPAESHEGVKGNQGELTAHQSLHHVSYQSTAGELVGWSGEPGGTGTIEVWAANFNLTPRQDVNWNLYSDNTTAHAFCFFDLYTGDLKQSYYNKFGYYQDQYGKWTNPAGATGKVTWVPRTIEPRGGQIIQDIPGTAQAAWFGGGEGTFTPAVLALVHDNYDPTLAAISMSIGPITDVNVVFKFPPNHTGTVNREFSEIKADGQIYSYGPLTPWNATWSDNAPRKLLVQLINDHDLAVEVQTGVCTGTEHFTKSYVYHR